MPDPDPSPNPNPNPKPDWWTSGRIQPCSLIRLDPNPSFGSTTFFPFIEPPQTYPDGRGSVVEVHPFGYRARTALAPPILKPVISATLLGTGVLQMWLPGAVSLQVGVMGVAPESQAFQLGLGLGLGIEFGIRAS